jgi:serine/threonine-protein kinase
MMFSKPARVIDRYLMCAPIASGGMATVHLGRLFGPKGFSRTVAIKQLHPQFSRDPDFVSMFLDEARLASRIHHPNVVSPLDVVVLDDEIFIVMEYVHGEALFRLMQLAGERPMPGPIAAAVMVQVLLGLHAAHEATDGRGNPLSIVHRDVSPQNILVGQDGVARVVDFGIAKAARRVHSTSDRKLKGKLGYMSPEQLRLDSLDRRSDVFSAGVVLWEMVTGKKLFPFDEPAKVVAKMLEYQPGLASSVESSITPELDEVLLKALQPDAQDRFQDAHEMALQLQAACTPAGALEVAAWVAGIARPVLQQRARWVAEAERITEGELTITRSLPVPSRSSDPALPAAPGRPVSSREDSTQPFALDPRLQGPTAPATPAETPVVRKRRLAPLLVAAIVLAGGAAAVVALVARNGFSPDEPASVTVLPAAAPAAPSAAEHERPARDPSIERGGASDPLAPPASSAPLPAPPPPPRVAAASPTKRATGGNPSRRTKSGASAAPAPEPPPVAPRPAAVDSKPRRPASCAVPYTVDEKGIKRFRSECF